MSELDYVLLNELDYVFLVVVGLSGLMAVLRGFLSEIIGLLGWVSAFLAASRFSGTVSPYLDQWIHQPSITGPLAFGLIFIATLVLFGLLGKLLKHLAGQVGLSTSDRILGLGFGLVRGVFILMMGFVLFQSFFQGREPPEMVRQSQLSPYLTQGTDWTMEHLPPGWALTRPTFTSTDIENMIPASMDTETVAPPPTDTP